MKSSSSITLPSIVLATLAAFALFAAAPRASAQTDINITAQEFHRLAYSGHLLTEMATKPELDAVCQTLLEVHRRNPQADPLALANVFTNALERFRSNAPVYLRLNDSRAEILAVYLEAFHRVPAHTNFNPATMTLLNIMMGDPGHNPPDMETAAQLIHAGSQGFISAGDKQSQRQALVDACARRAEENAAFRLAADAILIPETGWAFNDSAAQIINGNRALSNNPVMQALLALSANGTANLQMSRAALDNLFTNEMQRLRNSVTAVHQTQLDIMAAQTNFMTYLADTNLIEQMAIYEAAQKEPHMDTVAAAPASVHALSHLIETRDVTAGKYFRVAGNGMASLALAKFQWGVNTKLAAMQPWKAEMAFGKISKGLSGLGVAATVAQLVIGFATPSPEEIMLAEIGKVKLMIAQLGTDMHGRFDQVDRSLNTIQTTLDEAMENITEMEDEVQVVRQGLVSVQLDLHRLERQLFSSLTAEKRGALNLQINGALYYENRNPGSSLPWATYVQIPDGPENFFYTYASDEANNDISSPGFSETDLNDENLKARFATYKLNANLNYTKKALVIRSVLLDSGLGVLANPQDWFVSAYAYLQLALENPLHFRTMGSFSRLWPIIFQGQQLTNFIGRLTFTGTNINWPLHDYLLNNYAAKLTAYISQEHATEANYAHLHLDDFALDTWRNWAASAPRVTAATTAVVGGPSGSVPGTSFPGGAVAISAGYNHNLALKADGTVVGWGNNGYDRANGARAGSNVVAISAGLHHSLALKGDGTVVGWGSNDSNQRDVPEWVSNIVAVAASGTYSLALRADGKVFGWGDGVVAWNIPETDNHDIMAVAVGNSVCLALKTNGTVIESLPYSPPAELTNAVAIAVMPAWPVSPGNYVSDGYIATKADGTLVQWSRWHSSVQHPLSELVAVSAGLEHALALRTDGSILGWGNNNSGQATGISSSEVYSPTNVNLASITNVVAVSAGGYLSDRYYGHSLALRADGTVYSWGRNVDGQANVPAELTNAVSVACVNSASLCVQDATTNHSDGLPCNGVIWTNGAAPLGSQAGHALSFDGVDDFLDLTGGATVLGTNFTQEAWIYPQNTDADWHGFLGGQASTGINFRSPCVYVYEQTKLHFGFGTGSGWIAFTTTNVLQTNAWNHVALTYNGATYRVYVNGRPVFSANVTAVPCATPVTRIGAVENYFRGFIDDVRLWTVARTPEEIAADMTNRLTGAEANLKGYWRFDEVVDLAELTSGATRVAAGDDFSLALRDDGTVVAWGVNGLGQCRVPANLIGAVSIAAGQSHALALTTNNSGSVAAWGWNLYGQTNVPAAALSNVVAVAAGTHHNLALKRDSTVVGWGWSAFGQTNVPPGLNNVVAVAAGGQHSLALKADATVVGWGGNVYGQTNVPDDVNNAVAIAAGEHHSLALLDTGEVVAWGWNGYGQTNVPAGLSNVVAIAAHRNHSLALKADGTVAAWGCNTYGQTNLPPGLSNIVTLAAGGRHNVFLSAPSGGGAGGFQFVLADVPTRVAQQYLRAVYTNSVVELTAAGPLYDAANNLSGAKALLQAVLELGLSHTLSQDDVLHGFLYGNEALPDRDIVSSLLSAEANTLLATPGTRPMVLETVVSPRLNRFAARLNQCLANLAVTGQPEIPRIVGHTLRQLNLLRDAWAELPPPSVEMSRETNSMRIALFSEPFAHHALQECTNLNMPSWITVTATNWHNEEAQLRTSAGSPARFYRAVLPPAP